MQKMTKKFLSLLIVLTMLISLFAALPVSAAETSGTCGENATWSFDEATDTLTISGTGAARGYLPQDIVDSTGKIVVEEGISSIDVSFMDLGAYVGVTSIVFPESLVHIGGWFGNANIHGQVNVKIPANVMEIDDYTFADAGFCFFVSEENQYYSSDNGSLFNKDKTILIQYTGYQWFGNIEYYEVPDGVEKIASRAFGMGHSPSKLILSDTVTYLGAMGVDSGVESIYISKSVNEIELFDEDEFINCWGSDRMYEINVDPENKVYSSVDGVLFNKDKTELLVYPCSKNVNSYTVPDTVTKIRGGAIVGNGSENFTWPKNIKHIGTCSVGYIKQTVTIPTSVESIAKEAFCGMKTVYYEGKASQWAKIDIDENNYDLNNAEIIFADDDRPDNPATVEGKTVTYDGYWDYHTIEAENVPEGATVTYMRNGKAFIGASSAGTYKIDVTVKHKDYKTLKKTVDLVIEEKEVVVEDIEVFSRVYDGTVNVDAGGSLTGVIGGDTVTAEYIGKLQSKNAGIGNATVNVYLKGSDSGNYKLAQSSFKDIEVEITPKELNVSSVSSIEKEYDGTAKIAADVSLSGVIKGDDVSVTSEGVLPSKSAGTYTSETIALTIAGADAENYVLSQSEINDIEVTVVPKNLTISGISAVSRDTDGTNVVALNGGKIEGVINGDDVTAEMPTEGYIDSEFATGEKRVVALPEIVLEGADASNYNLILPEVYVDITGNVGGTCGDGVTWNLDDKTGILTIEGSGAIKDYSSTNKAPWSVNGTLIREIIINEGITEIGRMAFADIRHLERVTLPSTVEKIDSFSFLNSSIDRMIMPGITEIASSAFSGTGKIEKVDIACTFDEYKAMTEKNAKTNLKFLRAFTTVTDTDGNVVYAGMSIYATWSYDRATKTLEIGSFPGKEGRDMLNYKKESDVPWSQFIDEIEYVKAYDVGTIGSRSMIDSSSVKIVEAGEGVKRINSWSFFYATNLEKVILPASIEAIGTGAFWRVKNAEIETKATMEQFNSIVFGRSNEDFERKSVYVDGVMRYWHSDDVYWYVDGNTLTFVGEGRLIGVDDPALQPWSEYADTVTEIVIADGITMLGKYAFAGFENVTEITIPETVEYITVGVFKDMKELDTINLPLSVIHIGSSAFEHCYSLKTVNYEGDSEDFSKIEFAVNGNGPFYSAEFNESNYKEN